MWEPTLLLILGSGFPGPFPPAEIPPRELVPASPDGAFQADEGLGQSEKGGSLVGGRRRARAPGGSGL